MSEGTARFVPNSKVLTGVIFLMMKVNTKKYEEGNLQ
jgi:hypothetical protein